MSKQLTKLDGAFELIRTSFDPAWAAVALIIAVMLGGFAWLSAQVSRIEAKVEAACNTGMSGSRALRSSMGGGEPCRATKMPAARARVAAWAGGAQWREPGQG